jgi:hypothetical protein
MHRFYLLALLTALLALPSQAQPFTDITESLPDLGCYAPESLAPADYDSDGDADVAYRTLLRNDDDEWYEGSFLLTNTGLDGAGMRFEKEPLFLAGPLSTDDPEIWYDYDGRDLMWGDYDNDGDLDIIHTRGAEPSLLLRNDGGVFATEEVGLPPIQRSWLPFFDNRPSSRSDYDNDGDIDLFVGAVPESPDSEARDGYLLRNDGGTFEVVADDLPTVIAGNSDWGDYDGDGDRDLLIVQTAGWSPDIEARTVLLRNDGGTFVDSGVELEALHFGGGTFGDADNDGDLDIILAGPRVEIPRHQVYIYRNDDGFFTQTVALPTVEGEPSDVPMAVAWADYNGDGAGDFLLTVRSSGEDIEGRIYLRDDDGYTLAAVVPGPWLEITGSQAWIDLEGDGDLDYFVSGVVEENETGDCPPNVLLFRNDAPATNAAPTQPTTQVAEVSGDAVVLAWEPASDDHTLADALTYNLQVSDLMGSDIVSPMSRTTGQRLLPERGNVDHNTAWTLRDLPPGEYEWRVQAVDNAFNGSVFAEGGTFVVGTVDAEGDAALPAAFAVGAAFPNPLRTEGTLRLDLPAAAEVAVTLYDVLGREVLTVPPQPMAAGTAREVALDVRSLPSGVYLYRVEAALPGSTEQASGRLTVVR